jgi:hypothetical protein
MTDTASSIHSRIEAERKAALPHADALKTFRNYARGMQRGTLTAGQERILRGLLGNRFADNVCKRILSELRNRLRLARFEVPSPQSPATSKPSGCSTSWARSRRPCIGPCSETATMRSR